MTCTAGIQGTGGGLGSGGIAAVYPQSQHGQGHGLDPAFLAVQLRKLQKKQKGAVRELQAAAAREAFWRRSSHSAEQALDEVIKPASVIQLLRLILLTLVEL